jgi:hypothetical protein
MARKPSTYIEPIRKTRNQDGLNPPKQGGGKRKNRSERVEQRRKEAAERQAIHDARSLDEKRQRASRYGESPEMIRLTALAKEQEAAA